MVRDVSQLFQLIFSCGNATPIVVLHSCVVEATAIAGMHLLLSLSVSKVVHGNLHSVQKLRP